MLRESIKYIDPNGKQIESEYLGGIGIDFGSFGNGLVDGVLEASPIGIGKLVWDLSTDSQFRNDFVNGIKQILTNPVETAKAFAASKYNSWNSVLNGKGTDEQQYNVGNDLDVIVGTLLTGAGMKGIIEQINKAKWAKIGYTGIKGEKNT